MKISKNKKIYYTVMLIIGVIGLALFVIYFIDHKLIDPLYFAVIGGALMINACVYLLRPKSSKNSD